MTNLGGSFGSDIAEWSRAVGPPLLRRLLYVSLALSPSSGAVSAQPSCDHQTLSTHRAYYCVAGSGSPTVVLAAGAGSTSATWTTLADRLTTLGTVVTFDRAGLGQSARSAAPRTPTQIARELRELLDTAGIPGPYLLVGHSAGGWHVLRFAEQSPDDVDAVVLVDTPPTTFEAARLELLSEAERDARLTLLEEASAAAPDVVRRERRETPPDLERGFAPLPTAIPLVVVAADGQNFGNERLQRAHRDLWIELSRDWLILSYESELIIARGSGHMIHRERPELLYDLISAVIAQDARPGTR